MVSLKSWVYFLSSRSSFALHSQKSRVGRVNLFCSIRPAWLTVTAPQHISNNVDNTSFAILLDGWGLVLEYNLVIKYYCLKEIGSDERSLPCFF